MASKTLDTRLSYSSAKLLKNCSQKYHYYKVQGLKKDADSTQNEDAFNVGKAFHWVLETNGHTEKDLQKLVVAACKSYEVESHQAMIHAMLLRYLQVHQKSGMKVVGCELGLSTPDFIGFIDVVLADEEGGWYIADMKTAKMISDITIAGLALDDQLNLYASFAKEVSVAYKLDLKKFKGCRYRVTSKSVLKRKGTESYNEHVRRTAKNVKSFDYIIPIEIMDPKGTMALHKKLHAKSLRLRKGTLKPEKNRDHCSSYFRSCEWYSNCYGDTFTNLKDALEVVTSDNV